MCHLCHTATLLRCGLISSPYFGRNNDLPNLAGQARGEYKPYKCVSIRVSVRLSRQPYQKSWTAEDLLEEVHTKDLLKEVHANACESEVRRIPRELIGKETKGTILGLVKRLCIAIAYV